MGAFLEAKPKQEKGAAKWVVTFADLMSLLLCFFVLLLSFSEIDRQKYKQVAGSLLNAFGVQRKERVMEMPKGMKIIAKDFDQQIIETRIREDLGREIDDMLSTQLESFNDQVDLEVDENQILLRFMGESTFESGRDEIRDQLKPLLRDLARVLAKEPGDIVVSGHTDNVPIRGGRYPTNLRLSIARAAAVAEFMLSNSDMDPGRVSTMGFGEYRPIATNETGRGREKNRRVEIILSNLPQAR
ncbi:flagellar motor protein MotB [Desulfatitalea alkaliphila]|uniref:OmpA family protein n=1 Tax=Desulfatitalea alkaliphila TaxID=2929485 RepID=A0AA41R3C8_9BACT|nr:flagellar motor protein MotB [Desulfatitalea alkaliphila]MCJ8501277.1 OmpA family protein [Desulfatitalea alkaliphila]